jgi:hypothetical protein
VTVQDHLAITNLFNCKQELKAIRTLE